MEGERFNVWLGCVVVLLLLWSMKAGVKPGLDLHLTGIMVMTLVFRERLAFIGLNLVLLGLTLNGALAWESFALNALMTGAWGVLLAGRISWVVDRYFPRHFFVFVFLKAFFGAALVVIGLGVGAASVYALAGTYDGTYLLEEYLPYFLLLGFSEAWLSGMTTTLMLVYRPEWVASFDPSIYSKSK